MADLVIKDQYKLYVMILVVGLFVSFTGGYLVGAQNRVESVVQTNPLPANWDPAQGMQNLLDRCYKYMNDQVVNLVASQAKIEQAVSANTQTIRETCPKRPPAHREE